ncbi:uncharacterized protein [Coffea arabica]|uniref:RNase H type-1 domain-containing protein n=1 Tax=Coffea arabica TaxID=13443 RepID=A0A6P6UVX3_COFAR|nr:uncharacterized protein LOC113714198 [Coffea arabica]
MWRWWEAVVDSAGEANGAERIQLTVNVLWQLWKARNKMVFQMENVDAKAIVDKAQLEWLEYIAANETDHQTHASPEMEVHVPQHWEPPKEGIMRINTDAAISAIMVRTGLGIIARNWHGQIVKAQGIIGRRRSEAATEESLAIRSALEMTQLAGWTKIEVQSDCKNIVSSINPDNVQDCKIQTILEDIEALKNSFDSCLFSFVPRTVNICSHALAQFAVRSVQNFEWKDSFPIWLSQLASKDMG